MPLSLMHVRKKLCPSYFMLKFIKVAWRISGMPKTLAVSSFLPLEIRSLNLIKKIYFKRFVLILVEKGLYGEIILFFRWRKMSFVRESWDIKSRNHPSPLHKIRREKFDHPPSSSSSPSCMKEFKKKKIFFLPHLLLYQNWPSTNSFTSFTTWATSCSSIICSSTCRADVIFLISGILAIQTIVPATMVGNMISLGSLLLVGVPIALFYKAST